MLGLLARIAPTDTETLRDALTAHLRDLPRTPRGDRDLVARAEEDVQTDSSAALRLAPDGHTVLRTGGRELHAGRFETPTLGDLRTRAETARARSKSPPPRLRFHVVDGASPATDIGALQGAAPPGALFQVASQFNCLEAPDAVVVPVAEYFHDSTQGPRASISAFPGTILRHYSALRADGSFFVQEEDGPQINLLASVCAPGVAAVRNGYLTTRSIANAEAFLRALDERFDTLRIGLHDGVEVVFGHDWLGPVATPAPRIAQALTSTLAAGGYGRLDDEDRTMLGIVRRLQRAAYLGTLLGAASLGKSFAVLTLIGGGVFRNPVSVIWESILRAVDQVAPLLHRDLCVVVNGYALGRQLAARTLYEAAAARGGTLVVYEGGSVRVGAPD
ncbi:MAG TPA: hypothetical protein VGI39_19080 [Polyangiaceae bacterium]|jgi:hypothetical protein